MIFIKKTNNIIQRKIIRDFTVPLMLTVFLVLGIIWLTKLISIIELISTKGVSAYKFFSLAIMIIPDLIFYVMPFGVIIAFYVFFQNYFFTREIYILRNIPVSPKILFAPVKKIIFFLIIIEFINGFFIAPFAYKTFDKLKFDIKSNFVSVIMNPGTIETIRDDLVSYVDDVSKNDILNNLFIYRNSQSGQEFLLSKQANIVNNDQHLSLNMTDGRVFRVDPSGDINIIEFDYYSDDLSVVRAEQDKNQVHYKQLTLIDILTDLLYKHQYEPDVYAGILFKLFWIMLPLFIFIAARELYFYGEFRRNGLGRKHLLFWIVSISCVTVSFMIKTIATSNQIAAIFIALSLLLITYLVSKANFSEKI
ncbi:MAG: LptF/LptG family permease [Rickettsiales bacterium]|jgi:lipopolysaccharide export system permease protein|nr:LptF/LptG family permease [Rickettsiales bacterium]